MNAWCKSGKVPVHAGKYRLSDGTVAIVHINHYGTRWYAGTTTAHHVPGLIYKLRAELDNGTAAAA